MKVAYTSYKSTETTKNFLASEVGLITKTVQVDGTGVTADAYGRKYVKAGTIYPSNNTNAKGIIFEDVEVTNGEHAAPIIVAGRIIKDRLPESIASAAETALKASGIIFEASEPETYRSETIPKDFIAGTVAFTAADIAINSENLTLTISAVGSDNDTSICTVALSGGAVTCTKVKAGKTQITCTVKDSLNNTTDIVVPVEIA